MFEPNIKALLFSAGDGATDKYGQAVYPTAGVEVCCAIVEFKPTVQKTPSRSVESASRGQADEVEEAALLLFKPNVGIKLLDRVSLYGFTLRCIGVTPMISIGGTLDFYQCSFEVA